MGNDPIVKLVEANASNERLCACAARISTTEGTSIEIHGQSVDEAKNRKLIKKVFMSGHHSFIEHAVFTFAFCNVSALAEQFFIEFRLASFTVKSRRYVNFSKLGYYVPPGMEYACLEAYKSHVGHLFAEYRAFVDAGIPLEDARFVLPYCFSSNFYCTVNARELVHILKTIKHGRGKNIPELQDIYNQIVAEIEPNFPELLDEVSIAKKDAGREIACHFDYVPNHARAAEGRCELISCTDQPNRILNASQSLLENGYADYHVSGDGDPAFMHFSPRVMENINATFAIHDVSLSGVTHLARHRMQTIIIPPYQKAHLGRYVVPASIMEKPGMLKRYEEAFEQNIESINALRDLGIPNELYLCLSGNTLDVISTMNAREYRLFFSLRCCNRAQWEIQGIAKEMLRMLRRAQPTPYADMGPSCHASGRCPEGKLSCGRLAETIERYKTL